MCRLLGIYGEVDVWPAAALEFAKLAETGNVPPDAGSPGHRDGWGMARSSDDKTAMVEVIRRMGSACGAAEFGDTIRAMARQPHIFLCHLRKASPGIPVTMGNVHPFTRQGWALIHNGTIYNPARLPKKRSFNLMSDGSDSERLFAFLLDILSRTESNGKWHAVLADALGGLNIGYTGLNCVFSNGSDLFAIRDYQKMEDYLSLFYCVLPKGAIVCSEPIALQKLDPDKWQPMANRSIVRISGTPPKIDISRY